MHADRLVAAMREAAPDLFRGREETIYRLAEGILQEADDAGKLDARAVARADSATWDRDQNTRKQHRLVLIRVLQAANATGQIQAVLPTVETPVPRPAALPETAEHALAQQDARAIDRYLGTWMRGRGDDNHARMLALAIRLVTRVGMAEPVVVGALASLTAGDVERDGTLNLRITPSDDTDARYRFKPPKGCRDYYPKRRASRPPVAPLFDAVSPDGTASDRQRAVRQALRSTFQALLKDFRNAERDPPAKRIHHWRQFVTVARLLPVARGLPPVWLDLVGQYPLPTTAAWPPLEAGHDQRPPGERRLRAGRTSAPIVRDWGLSKQRPAGPVVVSSHGLPEDWPRVVKDRLAEMIREAEKLATRQGTLRQGQPAMDTLVAKRDELLDRMDAVMPTPSICHLALGWIVHKLANDRVKISSVRTYISRVFCYALLTAEQTADMSGWDDETVEELAADIIASRRWNARTSEHFRIAWADFLNYALAQGMLGEVERRIVGGSVQHSVARTEIVTPQEFDYVWRLLGQRPSCRDFTQYAIVLALAYYGGMRASEILGLTLLDVDDGAGELWVYIAAGKTPAARRKIPLHWVAPPWVVERVRHWLEWRRSEFQHLRDPIALFGPRHEGDGYTRHGLLKPLLEWLRPILGEGVDIHLLRHSCASWLQLRLHAVRFPGFADKLHHRGAWMFSEEGLEGVNQLLSAPGRQASQGGCDHWLYLTKFMGHRHVRTTLLHYCHTLGVIHTDMLERIWQGRPAKKTNGRSAD